MSIRIFKIPWSYYKNGKIKLPKKFKFFIKPMKKFTIYTEGDHQPVKYTRFNPSSRKHIEIWLKDKYDWKPEVFTPKGGAKLSSDTLDTLEYPETEDLKEYLKLVKDHSQLLLGATSILKAYDEKDHCIRHRCDQLGASKSHRMAHSSINIAQIPTQKEFRELFIAPPGYSLVGADLANIELRILAHYIAPYDNGEYVKAVLSKDMHWLHANLAGFIDTEEEYDEHNKEHKQARTQAKTFIFSWLYGSGNTVRGMSLWYEGCLGNYTQEEYDKASASVENRIVEINGKLLFPLKKDYFIEPTEHLILATIYGTRIAEMFINRVKGIKELIEDTKQEYRETGKIKAIDGRLLTPAGESSAFNTRLQGTAAVVTKRWIVNINNNAIASGLVHNKDYIPNAIIHDEYQVSVKNEHLDTFTKIVKESCEEIKDQLGLDIPIEADTVIGKSWNETH